MGCHLAIFTQNEKTGKGSHIAMLLLLGNCHLVIYLKKWKKREFVIGEWGMLSIIKMGSIRYH